MSTLSRKFRKLLRQKRWQFILAPILMLVAFILPPNNVWGFFGALAVAAVAIILGVVPIVDFIEENAAYVRKI